MLMNKLTPEIREKNVSRRTKLIILISIYIAWCYANLAANGLFALSDYRGADFRLIGEFVYFTGIAFAGIILPLFLIRQWQIPFSLMPEKKVGLGFWIAFAFLMIFAVVLGLAAMADQGVYISDLFQKTWVYLISPIPVFVPTMIAYSLLWHVLFLRGFQQIFGQGVVKTTAAILVTASFYAIYHLCSIDEITSLNSMLSEILITFCIRCVLLAFVVLTNSLLPAFFCDWIMNYFIFMPMEHFHPAPWRWPIGMVTMIMVWMVFKYTYREID